MIITLISWIWIFFTTGITGFACYLLLDRIAPIQRLRPHLIMVLGLCFLTVYAQFFSLFYKVGFVANLILLIVCALLLLFMRKPLICSLKGWIRDGTFYHLAFAMFLLLLTALRASTEVLGDDVYLYHLQAVRWITDYGVVPGLGNLNTRFAFNNAFHSLQALFSFEYAPPLHYPLHNLNGFIAWILLMYAVFEMKFWKDLKFHCSDFARVALIMLVCKNAFVYSSPSTDFFPAALVGYIFSEWISAWEEKQNTTPVYSVLSVLTVFAITLKLSTAFVCLLVLMPAIQLIRARNVRAICLYLFSGILVLLPFLLRNIIISGWLLYPFDKIDLFHFDWKMPIATVIDESIRTTLSGRKIYNYLPSDAPFSVWFPHWVQINGKTTLVYLGADLIASMISLFLGIRKIRRENDWTYLHVTLTLEASLLYVLLAAPDPRFCKIYMLLIPLLPFGLLLERVHWASLPLLIPVGMTILFTLYIPYIYSFSYIEPEFYRTPSYYADFKGIPYDFEGLTMYVPETSGGYNAISWNYFPSILYDFQLDLIELRGENYTDGFRTKPGVEHLF